MADEKKPDPKIEMIWSSETDGPVVMRVSAVGPSSVVQDRGDDAVTIVPLAIMFEPSEGMRLPVVGLMTVQGAANVIAALRLMAKQGGYEQKLEDETKVAEEQMVSIGADMLRRMAEYERRQASGAN